MISMSDHLIASKTTTQKAPLERFLTYLRTRKIVRFVPGRTVLDFGCGAHFKTLRAMGAAAHARYGIDSVFKSKPAFETEDHIHIVGGFSDLDLLLKKHNRAIDLIVSLACFEHLKADELGPVLRELYKVSSPNARLMGTVPRPAAKPVLEFLSYKLRLIDASQIEDHEVYYDRNLLVEALSGTGWILESYRTFQFGFNSFFVFKKADADNA